MIFTLSVISNHSTTMIMMKATECESSDSDESEYHQSQNEYDDDSSADTPITDSGKMPSKTAFVVYWLS